MQPNIKIKVLGIGGSGGNTISRMMKAKIKGVELIAINTDIQDLNKIQAHKKIRIGRNLTKGLGTGMNPEIGRAAAEEQKEEIKKELLDCDLLFIAGGLGGGTCSGASPFVAELAKSLGILTIAVVTRPFSFEGVKRLEIAKNSEKTLKEKVDSLIVISNDKLLSVLDPNITVLNAFWKCDEILMQAVSGISDLIVLPGIINIGFADIKAIMKNSGAALFGMGWAKGEKRAEEAIRMALNSPLLDISYKGAKGVLFNISGGKDISLNEVDEIAKIVTKEISPEAKVIFGAICDEKLPKGEIKVTVIATGF